MSDLISRSALMRDMGVDNAVKYGNETAEQQHNSYSTLMKYEIADYIEDAPPVDAVEVVHCEDCAHRGKTYECPMRKIVYPLEGSGHLVDFSMDGGFCHCGKRKTEGYDGTTAD